MSNTFEEPSPANSFLAAHVRLLRKSYHDWTGKDLVDPELDDETAAYELFEADFALLSHGTEEEPILNYGNRTALELFELDWRAFTRLPSRFTAEAPDQVERARLLEQVTTQGYIDDYSGIRIARSGRRFKIREAVVWNVVDDEGNDYGQAAMFREWVDL
jgi:hypothetical protein